MSYMAPKAEERSPEKSGKLGSHVNVLEEGGVFSDPPVTPMHVVDALLPPTAAVGRQHSPLHRW